MMPKSDKMTGGDESWFYCITKKQGTPEKMCFCLTILPFLLLTYLGKRKPHKINVHYNIILGVSAPK